MNRYTTYLAVSNLLGNSSSSVDLDGIDWEFLIRLSAGELVSPALYLNLLGHPQFQLIPEDVRDFLEATTLLNRQRNEKMTAQAIEAFRLLNAEGIRPLFLKGVANLLGNLYEDPAARISADIDFYVEESRAADAIRLLKAHGYTEPPDPWFYDRQLIEDSHHFPPLIHLDHIASIEVHRHATSQRVPPIITDAEMVESSRVYPVENSVFLMPSREMRIMHNIIHTQLQDRSYSDKTIRLRQLYDFVLLCNESPADVDWRDIQDRFARFNLQEALTTYVLSAEILLGFQRPPGIEYTSDTMRWFNTAKRQIRWPFLYRYKIYSEKLRKRSYRLFDLRWYAFTLKHRRRMKGVHEEARRDTR